jgi:hypothetical protein
MSRAHGDLRATQSHAVAAGGRDLTIEQPVPNRKQQSIVRIRPRRVGRVLRWFGAAGPQQPRHVEDVEWRLDKPVVNSIAGLGLLFASDSRA